MPVLQPPDEDDKDSIGAIDVAISPNNPDIVLATTWDKVRAAGRADLRQGLEALPVDRRRAHLDRRAAGAAADQLRRRGPAARRHVRRPDGHRVRADRARSRVPDLEHRRSATSTASSPRRTTARTGPRSARRQAASLQQISGGFAWWFGRVWVDPQDEDHVFVAGIQLAESINGGESWTLNGAVHADQHAMAWDPFVADRVYLGNDGGFYRNNDNGGSGTPWTKTAEDGDHAVLRHGLQRAGRPAAQRRHAGQQLAQELAGRRQRHRRLGLLRRRRRHDEPDRPGGPELLLRVLPVRRLLGVHAGRQPRDPDPRRAQELGGAAGVQGRPTPRSSTAPRST